MLVNLQVTAFFLNVTMLMGLIENRILAILTTVSMIPFCLICVFFGCQEQYDDIQMSPWDYLYQLFFAILIGTVLFYNQTRFTHLYFEELLSQIESQKEFKSILHNLEESLIMLSDKCIEYVNDKFL